MHQLSEKTGQKKRSEYVARTDFFYVRLLSVRGGRKVAFSSSQPRCDVEEQRPTAKVVADTAEKVQTVVVS